MWKYLRAFLRHIEIFIRNNFSIYLGYQFYHYGKQSLYFTDMTTEAYDYVFSEVLVQFHIFWDKTLRRLV